MFAQNGLTDSFIDVRNFILAERAKTVSDAEWRFRLKGYGYSLRAVDRGFEIARLPQNTVLGVIEA